MHALFLKSNTAFGRKKRNDENQLLQCATSILLKKDKNTFALKK
jgi:hypothetical protein